MTKAIDSILDLMSSLDISISNLQARATELGLQLEGDSNKNEINNKDNSIVSVRSAATVELQDNMPATAAQAVEEAKKTFKKLAKVSPARLWQDFVAFNRLKGRKGYIHLRAFLGFLKVWENRLDVKEEPVKSTTKSKLTSHEKQIFALAAKAPAKNRDFHARDMVRLYGQESYDKLVQNAVNIYGVAPFLARQVVHGQAVQNGQIQP